jgi:hypothetical protein
MMVITVFIMVIMMVNGYNDYNPHNYGIASGKLMVNWKISLQFFSK